MGILIIGAMGVGVFFGLRMLIHPTFYIETYNPVTHTGYFVFGGKKSFFGGVTKSVESRNGFKVIAEIQSDKSVSFNLYKKDKFIKTLDKK